MRWIWNIVYLAGTFAEAFLQQIYSSTSGMVSFEVFRVQIMKFPPLKGIVKIKQQKNLERNCQLRPRRKKEIAKTYCLTYLVNNNDAVDKLTEVLPELSLC